MRVNLLEDVPPPLTLVIAARVSRVLVHASVAERVLKDEPRPRRRDIPAAYGGNGLPGIELKLELVKRADNPRPAPARDSGLDFREARRRPGAPDDGKRAPAPGLRGRGNELDRRRGLREYDRPEIVEPTVQQYEPLGKLPLELLAELVRVRGGKGRRVFDDRYLPLTRAHKNTTI